MNSTKNLSCSCCLKPVQLMSYPTCAAAQNQSMCACVNTTNTKTKTSNLTCECNGKFNNNPVVQKDLIFTDQKQCGCMNVTNGTTTSLICSCCLANNSWEAGRPLCNVTSTQEKCNCSNVLDTVTKQQMWQCDCSNKNKPTQPVKGAKVPLTKCGCDISNTTVKNCDCCLDQLDKDTAYLNSLQCPATAQNNSDCTCIKKNNSTFQCSCLDKSKITYKGAEFSTSQCNCLDNTTCKCCLPNKQQDIVP